VTTHLPTVIPSPPSSGRIQIPIHPLYDSTQSNPEEDITKSRALIGDDSAYFAIEEQVRICVYNCNKNRKMITFAIFLGALINPLIFVVYIYTYN
jgi:hypothetical protein